MVHNNKTITHKKGGKTIVFNQTKCDANEVSMTMEEIFKRTKIFKQEVFQFAHRHQGPRVKVLTEVRLFQAEREAEVATANAQLAVKKAKGFRLTKVADVEAAKAITIRDFEL
ncbi:hypothetical protein ZIOFF_013680 [Zingiber officinale]|uniref:Uncharacterized protein n=1 Tax=Zingiber officinale TaxID=94328 RepID=A0A8J5HBZ2_ZINOF|nr:hypothetical protein ZIOFF_013680 [Zingiber officinale]